MASTVLHMLYSLASGLRAVTRDPGRGVNLWCQLPVSTSGIAVNFISDGTTTMSGFRFMFGILEESYIQGLKNPLLAPVRPLPSEETTPCRMTEVTSHCLPRFAPLLSGDTTACRMANMFFISIVTKDKLTDL